ncbi:stalk domain-containing protein [Paenibacillus silviterrae]|uniref:stalk domain-containing protein n=1 Tax=Paenibacillus silviterrae TaxID=3242194 RepID=UPI0025438A46|nr:stalk domain-containing protein [Paenibacillus chinjuensis]
MKKILALLSVALISGVISVQAWANSHDKEIGIEIDGSKLTAVGLLVDGRTMVPMRAIFEKLQSEVIWDQEKQSVTATKGDTTVKLIIGDVSARVNNKTNTLDVPPMLVEGTTYVPLRFVSESLGAKVDYDANRSIALVHTAGSDATSDSHTRPNELSVEPFVVKGRVTDRQGKPLEGVEIIADNQLARDSYQEAFTDTDGYYQIDLPEINTTWNMISYFERKFEGKVQKFNLTSVTDRPFGGNKGAIRDFVWDDINGMVIIQYNYPDKEQWSEFSLDQVELTLTPVSRLIDGTEGKVIKEVTTFSPDGPGLQSVPIAKYEISARWVPAGMDPVPMLVSKFETNQYVQSIVTSDFSAVVGTTKRVAIKVSFP